MRNVDTAKPVQAKLRYTLKVHIHGPLTMAKGVCNHGLGPATPD